MNAAPVKKPGLATPQACLPELLAPAGDWDCVRAAVENGADAVYFGLDKFNARMRAHNFTEADLPALMSFLHQRGVRGYVTFNTLVFPEELTAAAAYLQTIILSGVDAAIVQDAGICRLIRALSPDFPIHASTQMTITSRSGIEMARELGCSLAVLARECSIKEITALCQDSPTPNGAFPLEVFVHGALCVAYSGQCLTSESLGGRSANRGECAQACRMPYELVCDGRPMPLGDRRYLLSPQDLAGLDLLPELVRSGVASLKIEGRLKSPEYVASITRLYRQALDRVASLPPNSPNPPIPSSDRYEMEMSFSRGLYTGWFQGIDNQKLVHARFGKKRGVLIGRVARVLRDSVWLDAVAAVKPGDGVVFDAGHPEEPEEGGRVYHAYPVRDPKAKPSFLELQFGHGNVNWSRLHVGDHVWKTSDPDLDKRLRQSFAGTQPKFQQPIQMEVFGSVSQPLSIIATDAHGHSVQITSSIPLEPAEKTPLTTERLREQLGRLGGTPHRLSDFKNHLQGPVHLPISELNRLRRKLVEDLDAQRSNPQRWTLLPQSNISSVLQSLRQRAETARLPDPFGGSLVVLVRNLSQLEAALDCGLTTLYCEFENPKLYREAVLLYRSAQSQGKIQTSQAPLAPGIFLAPPRIFKTGEEWILKQVLSAEPDGYLVRNPEHLKFYASHRCIGDFSLNIANALAAEFFKSRHKLERLTASYDLNASQLQALLTSAPPEWFEITLHQHMPMFHMEHCVFCAFLSSGKDYHDCGRPCDRHSVVLRDRVGAEHPLKADAGCRNTLYNSQAQTGAEWAASFQSLGARWFRLEFLNEKPDEVRKTVENYRRLLDGSISGSTLWREMKWSSQLGVTRGQLASTSIV